jgi:hypothetical protein
VRIAEQCRGDSETLPHTKRETPGPAASNVRQANEIEQLVNPPDRDPGSSGQRTKVVMRATAGMNGARLQQRANFT